MKSSHKRENMFDVMCSFESLLSAYKRAVCAGRYKEEVLVFGYNLEANIISLRNNLLSGNYKHGNYREFIINDSKKRHIKAATFRDRIVHNAIHHAIEPLFDRTFISDSYACRKGKGTHKALSLVKKWVHKSQYSYVLSCDVSSYFASIDHAVLMRILFCKIKDTKVSEICKNIIESSGYREGRGIPIGNLTSQLFANIYLDVFDRFIKKNFSAVGYIRYMDDFLIFGNSKKELNEIKGLVGEFLYKYLFLILHPSKATVFPVSLGVSFLGYNIFKTHITLRKSTVNRFIKRVKKFKDNQNSTSVTQEEILNNEVKFGEGVASWLVYAKQASSYGLITCINKQNNFLGYSVKKKEYHFVI